MRTKTLLIAAAALVAGVISSQAQVYSQNIVGYINLTVTNGAKFSLFSDQLKAGVSNGLNEVFSSLSTNQSGDVVYLWNNQNQSFLGGGYYFYQDPVAGATWYDQAGNGNLVTNFPIVTVGSSFFIQGNGTAPSDTLTVIGAVSIPNGGTNTESFLGGSLYVMEGSQLPVSGGLYNLGLNPPDGTVVFPWSAATQSFTGQGGYAFYSGVNNGSNGGWYTQAGNGVQLTGTGVTFTNGGFTFSDLPINVGDGFFISGGTVTGVGSTNWTQSLNVQ